MTTPPPPHPPPQLLPQPPPPKDAPPPRPKPREKAPITMKRSRTPRTMQQTMLLPLRLEERLEPRGPLLRGGAEERREGPFCTREGVGRST